jgi:hypothetical protein
MENLMTTHNKKQRKIIRTAVRHLTETELRAIIFVSTLLLAGIAIALRINDPVVWAFLGTALGIISGQAKD